MDIEEIRSLRPEWKTHDIRISPLAGGITNVLYLVEDAGRFYKVRIPGEKTNLFLDRDGEVWNNRSLEPTGVVPRVIEYKKDTKISIFEYIPGETAHKDTFRSQRVREEALVSMKRIHESNIELCTRFDVFGEIKRYLELAKSHGNQILGDYPINRLVEKTKIMGEEIGRDGSRWVACHNDLLPENLNLAQNKVYIIDWEYGGMNDPCFDIADFIVELDPVLTPDEEEHVVTSYFGVGKGKEKRRIDFYKFLCDFLWSLWAVTQYHVSRLNFDFQTYSRIRFDRTLRHEEKLQEKYPDLF